MSHFDDAYVYQTRFTGIKGSMARTKARGCVPMVRERTKERDATTSLRDGRSLNGR